MSDPAERAADARYVAHPSWKNWLGLWLLAWLIVPAIVAHLLRKATRLVALDDRLIITRGLMRTRVEEVFLVDIRALDVHQSLRQRLRGIGDLTITTASRTNPTHRLLGFPDPHGLKDLIVSLRQDEGSAAETTD